MLSILFHKPRGNLLFSILFILILTQCGPRHLPPGDPDLGGLQVPNGFEVVVVADSVGKARHLAVKNNGDVYVKLRYPQPEGENIALRDTDGDGKADIIKYWGDYGAKGNYGTAMRIHKGYIYVSTAGEVYRHKLSRKLMPSETAELLLIDDYKNAEHGYEHIAKPITFDDQGHMYVPFGSPGDVCQIDNRRPGSPGQFPCPELEWHGGVWQFSDSKPNQLQKDGKRYATGIRSIVGMDWNHQERTLYALQHGRDNMHRTSPDHFSPRQSALLPSEELLRVDEGSDAGWPYVYYDQMKEQKLINPEYLNEADAIRDPSTFTQPIIGFPGHFAPNDLLFYDADQFPEYYRHGAFVAFHGSTIRAPYPQAGYFIGFIPWQDGKLSTTWDVFADGFAGVDTIINTSDADHRPMGLALGPDGSLYISESEKGKIWRVMFKGDKETFGADDLVAMEKHKLLPHIKTPDEVLDNLDPVRAKAGAGLYNTYCGACHLADGQGDGTRYPSLHNSARVSGDNDTLINILLQGLQGQIIVHGQAFDGVMPSFDYLENEQIAQILTYLRQSFGNEGPSINAGEVQRARRRLSRQAQRAQEEDI
ncbi:MAG: c-type cytochrome [Saprospiraceae bacterium]|nr:c-type cytochrome [Saprospiraceae bacterium]